MVSSQAAVEELERSRALLFRSARKIFGVPDEEQEARDEEALRELQAQISSSVPGLDVDVTTLEGTYEEKRAAVRADMLTTVQIIEKHVARSQPLTWQ